MTTSIGTSTETASSGADAKRVATTEAKNAAKAAANGDVHEMSMPAHTLTQISQNDIRNFLLLKQPLAQIQTANENLLLTAGLQLSASDEISSTWAAMTQRQQNPQEILVENLELKSTDSFLFEEDLFPQGKITKADAENSVMSSLDREPAKTDEMTMLQDMLANIEPAAGGSSGLVGGFGFGSMIDAVNLSGLGRLGALSTAGADNLFGGANVQFGGANVQRGGAGFDDGIKVGSGGGGSGGGGSGGGGGGSGGGGGGGSGGGGGGGGGGGNNDKDITAVDEDLGIVTVGTVASETAFLRGDLLVNEINLGDGTRAEHTITLDGYPVATSILIPDFGNVMGWAIPVTGGHMIYVASDGRVWTTTAIGTENAPDPIINLNYHVIDKDGDVSANSATATIVFDEPNISSTNLPPVITGGTSGTIVENSNGVIMAMTASDPEGSAISWRLIGRDAALFTVNAQGVVSAVGSGLDFESIPAGGYQVQAIAQDAGGVDSAPVDLSITVTNDPADDTNLPPVITGSASGSVMENMAGAVILDLNATDPEGRPITWSLTGRDAALFAIDANGTVRTINGLDFEAPPAGGYQVNAVASDGVKSTSQPLAITVTNDPADDINLPPVITGSASGSVMENMAGAVILDLNATDPEGRPITWSLTGRDAALFAIDANGTVRTINGLDFEAPPAGGYQVNAVASDGVKSTSQPLAITVTNDPADDTNLPPVITGSASGSVMENMAGAVILDLNATDPEGRPITWSLTGRDAALFAIDANGTVRTINGLDFEAPPAGGYQVNAVASDGVKSTSQPLAITVTNDPADDTNLPPVITGSASGSVMENMAGAVILDLNATDPEGRPITWSLTGRDAALFAIDANGTVRTINGLDFEAPTAGGYQVNAVASDGVKSTSQPLAITVTNDPADDINLPPVITGSASGSVMENMAGAVILDLNATDPEGRPITWSLTGRDAALFAIDANGTVRTINGLDFEAPPAGGYQVNAVASDGVKSTSQPLAITVTNDPADDTNLPPVITGSASGSVMENMAGAVILDLNATDPEGRPITWSLTGRDAALFAIDANGTVRTINGLDFEAPPAGGYQVNAVASDGVKSTSQPLAITVTNDPADDINLPPVITGSASGSVMENMAGAVILDLNATDPEGRPITWSLTGRDAALFAIDANGTVRTINGLDFEAPPAGGYQVNAVASDGVKSTSQPLAITVTNDPADDTNLPPVITGSASGSVMENMAGAVILDLNATDPEGRPITWSLTGRDAALFAIDANGTVRTINGLDFEAPPAGGYQVNAVASDGVKSTSQPLAITVTNDPADDTNLPPVITGSASGSVMENMAGAVILDLNATDPEGRPITWSLTGRDAALFAIDANGTVRTINGLDFEAPPAGGYQVNAVASDGVKSTSQPLAITVTNDPADDINLPPVITGSASGSVMENMAGAVILDLNATDPEGRPITWSLTGRDAALFAIDANGTVRTINGLDFEAPPAGGYQVNAVASDGVQTTSQPLTITVRNVNDVAPTIDNFTVTNPAENAAIGTLVVDLNATDGDVGGGTQTWSIVGGNTGNVFTIDANGRITVAAGLNAEAIPSYTLTVRATDAGNPALFSERQVTIGVTNVNDVAPTIDNFTVTNPAENAAIGTLVVDLNATDGDVGGGTQTWSIVGGNTGNVFTIDANGRITVAAGLNAEAIPSYTLTVRATDAGNPALFSERQVTIGVTNVNDVAPTIDNFTVTNPAENAAIGTLVVDLNATDGDVGGGTQTWSIVGGNTGNVFTIDANGRITVAAGLNAEAIPSYTLTVRATDAGNPALFSERQVTIGVTNVNDVAPTIDNFTVTNPAENAAIGTLVVDLNATDGDVGGGTQTWSIVGGNTGNVFTIDANGRITVAAGLNAEAIPSYTLTVRATDAGNPALFSERQVTIGVTNVNDVAPTIDNFTVTNPAENAAIGTLVVDLNATDGDVGGGTQTWSIVGGNTGNVFTIDANGRITVAAGLNAEAIPSYTLTVRATDAGNPALFSERQVTIGVTNVNDVAPTIDNFTVTNPAENAAIGTLVVDLNATDGDVGGGTQTWSIVGGNTGNVFTIDANGRITVAAGLNAEAIPSYTLTVRATDAGNPALFSERQVTIGVTNVNDVAPTIDNFTVTNPAENAAIGTLVVDLNATDGDVGGGTQTWSIVGGNTGNVFTIDANGRITVAAGLNAEAIPSYTLTVRATDAGNPALFSERQVTIGVTNVNDVAPTIDNFTVTNPAENAAIGTLVVDLNATDGDVGGGTQTWSIVGGNTGNVFTIDANGRITVAAGLNAEAIPSYTLTVRATDAGNPALFSERQVTIGVTNVNDVAPTIDNFTVTNPAENAAIGTLVVDLNATDGDVGGGTQTWSIVGGNTGNAFTIDASGRITVAAGLDFEAIQSYTLTIRATDAGNPALFSERQVTIGVTNDPADDNRTPVGTDDILISRPEDRNATLTGNLITGPGRDDQGNGPAKIHDVLGALKVSNNPGTWIYESTQVYIIIRENGDYEFYGKPGQTAINNLNYTIIDQDGDISAPILITMDVSDALPTAVADNGNLGDPTSNGFFAVNIGTGSSVLANDFGGNNGFSVISLGNVSFNGQPSIQAAGNLGTFAINAAGILEYKPNANMTGGTYSDRIEYTIRDADGDVSTAIATVNFFVGAPPQTLQSQEITLANMHNLQWLSATAYSTDGSPASIRSSVGGFGVAGGRFNELNSENIYTYDNEGNATWVGWQTEKMVFSLNAGTTATGLLINLGGITGDDEGGRCVVYRGNEIVWNSTSRSSFFNLEITGGFDRIELTGVGDSDYGVAAFYLYNISVADFVPVANGDIWYDEYNASGNVMSNDLIANGPANVVQVRVDGVLRDVPQDGQYHDFFLDNGSGYLSINQLGDYYIVAYDYSPVEFGYVIKDRDGDTSESIVGVYPPPGGVPVNAIQSDLTESSILISDPEQNLVERVASPENVTEKEVAWIKELPAPMPAGIEPFEEIKSIASLPPVPGEPLEARSITSLPPMIGEPIEARPIASLPPMIGEPIEARPIASLPPMIGEPIEARPIASLPPMVGEPIEARPIASLPPVVDLPYEIMPNQPIMTIGKIAPIDLKNAVDLDHAIHQTLAEQLSGLETKDLDHAIHEFLIKSALPEALPAQIDGRDLSGGMMVSMPAPLDLDPDKTV